MLRALVNDTFTDVYDAFDHAAGATWLGWPVVFVGRCERYQRWFVWVSAPPGATPDETREIIKQAAISVKAVHMDDETDAP